MNLSLVVADIQNFPIHVYTHFVACNELFSFSLFHFEVFGIFHSLNLVCSKYIYSRISHQQRNFVLVLLLDFVC